MERSDRSRYERSDDNRSREFDDKITRLRIDSRSRSRSRERDSRKNDRDRIRGDVERHRERETERARERDKDRDRDRGDRDRDRERNSDRDRDRNRDVDRRDREAERDSNYRRGDRDGKSTREDDRKRSERDKNGRHGESSSTNRQHDSKKERKSTSQSKDSSSVDVTYDASDLQKLESFMADEETEFVDEEAEAERLAAERKRRREEILRKHQAHKQELGNCSDAGGNNDDRVDIKISQTESVDIFAEGGDGLSAQVPSAVSVAASNIFDDEAQHLAAERSAVEKEASERKGSSAFDIFSSSPSELEIRTGGPGKGPARDSLLEGEDPHLQSNFDDVEGYYKARIGEVIQDRYRTLGVVGKGVFSTVLKCVDLRAAAIAAASNSIEPTDANTHAVAIKMIRNNDTMRKASEKERSILLKIREFDPQDRKHCVRLQSHFEYRNHIALVFEYQQMNLRETLKKFGKDVGINIGAIRLYARQLFTALKHIADLRIVHADIKLDNILCSGDLKQVKLCDFGSAFFETDTDNDPTPYLTSRFYRAPEVILGQPYDRALDLWAIAVCLFELFTGHVMFPGRTNNEMLRLQMAVKGRFPTKMLRSHLRQYELLQAEVHFDADLRFKQYEYEAIADAATGDVNLVPVRMRAVDITGPTRDLSHILRSAKAGADDGRLVTNFAQLLEQCLILDGSKRLTCQEALKHPFFATK